MKVVGLITEYNPFHNGHAYHIAESKAKTGADYVVIVMSSNFVQRGEPAIIDKFTRTKMALESGGDLVIEIPTVFSTSSAEYFAKASIALLNATGVVDTLCFGSELGAIEPLKKIADTLVNNSDAYREKLKHYSLKGFNFPKARGSALLDILDLSLEHIIGSPNNILGIEYLKALALSHSQMTATTIKRIGKDYHDLTTDAPISSASAIRHLLSNQSNSHSVSYMMPPPVYHHLEDCLNDQTAPIFPEDLFSLLKYRLTITPRSSLRNIQAINEGLENRILSSIHKANHMTELLALISTKRYTNTRIQRALLHVLLDIQKNDFDHYVKSGFAQYIKVLGFKKDAQPLMKALKCNTKLPIIVNVKDAEKALPYLANKMLSKEITATRIYNQAVYNKYGTHLKNDYTNKVIIY